MDFCSHRVRTKVHSKTAQPARPSWKSSTSSRILTSLQMHPQMWSRLMRRACRLWTPICSQRRLSTKPSIRLTSLFLSAKQNLVLLMTPSPQKRTSKLSKLIKVTLNFQSNLMGWGQTFRTSLDKGTTRKQFVLWLMLLTKPRLNWKIAMEPLSPISQAWVIFATSSAGLRWTIKSWVQPRNAWRKHFKSWHTGAISNKSQPKKAT